ncbi:Actin-1 [Nymphon striatum]|nr:Actin-1 [Nymphon striatum]
MSRTTGILDLPYELLTHIICFNDITTIAKLSRTCKLVKHCCDSKFVWTCKWKELRDRSPLDFSPFTDDSDPDENPYKERYRRLWCFYFTKCTSEGLFNLVPCPECKQLTCDEECSRHCHIAIDIGSSTTRIATEMHDGFFNYSHHPTTIGMIKKSNDSSSCYPLPQSSNSDYTLSNSSGLVAKSEAKVDCSQNHFPTNGIPIPKFNRHSKRSTFSVGMAHSMPGFETDQHNLYCSSLPCDSLRYRLNRLEVTQQHHSFHEENLPASPPTSSSEFLQELNSNEIRDDWNLVCLECAILKKDQRSASQRYSKNYKPIRNDKPCTCLCHHRNKQDKSHRRYWYCYESAIRDMYGKECVAVSPLEAVTVNNDLACMEFHITHLLKIYQPHVDLHRPNVTAVFCELWNMTWELRSKIAKLMFEKIKVPRLTFVNKAMAIAYMKNQQTCIVVDSGCFNTVTSIVIDYQIDPLHVHRSPVGGHTVTEHLLDTIKMNHPKECLNIHSLDHSAVKKQCHIPYHLPLEEQRCSNYQHKIRVKSCCSQSYSHFDIGAAHYLAPELMYSALNLPEIIKHLTTGLKSPFIEDLLNHIIIAGGNSRLEGFARRLTKDIRDIFPRYRDFVKVHHNRQEKSDAIHGALLYSQSNSSGAVRREEYIFHGPEIFQRSNSSSRMNR